MTTFFTKLQGFFTGIQKCQVTGNSCTADCTAYGFSVLCIVSGDTVPAYFSFVSGKCRNGRNVRTGCGLYLRRCR